MRIYFLLSFFCVILLFEEFSTLKCRTDNQQTNEQFRKVMQICRRRNSINGKSGDFSNGSDSDESDSDEDMFDKRFLSGINRRNTTSYENGSNNRGRFGVKQQRQVWSQQSSFKENNMKNRQNGGKNNSDTDRYGNSRNSGLNFQNDSHNNQGENENQGGSACITQCFFNELNLVDSRGFPEQNSVTGIMTENIQNPELRDFVEESIIECFHYLRSNVNQDKCRFSQNLLSCLADKGRERCDDWNDD